MDNAKWISSLKLSPHFVAEYYLSPYAVLLAGNRYVPTFEVLQYDSAQIFHTPSGIRNWSFRRAGGRLDHLVNSDLVPEAVVLIQFDFNKCALMHQLLL